jgi:Zn-dependent M28 family amino/carboxypeptidase
MRTLLRLLLAFSLVWGPIFFYLRNPSIESLELPGNGPAIDPVRLRKHVEALAAISPSRAAPNPISLDRAKQYIVSELQAMGFRPHLQQVGEVAFQNVIVRIGEPTAREVVVVGAHYDVAGDDNPGADDNASGVAGLLELARALLAGPVPKTRAIELVAYTLEEPPHFGTSAMGSVAHARDLKRRGISVHAMISLEMLGYFSDVPYSQSYPSLILHAFYPWQGNFIALVGRPADRELTRLLKRAMSARSAVPVYSINAPPILPGVDLSDHRSYWEQGWPAVMVTDTAFFRNSEYHQAGDTPDRLDYSKMSEVVRGVHAAVEVLTN